MIKRFVILQDEQLVMRELTKPRVDRQPGRRHGTAVDADRLDPGSAGVSLGTAGRAARRADR